MRRKSLSHNAYVRKLNRQMRRHPNYRKGMRVTKVDGSLYHLASPEPLVPKSPPDMERFRADPGLQRVLWDSVSAVGKKYYCANTAALDKMLPRNLLFRISREGRRSMLLQSRLKSLHHAVAAHRRVHGTWPADLAPLIQSLHLMDPWQPGELLQVRYTVPTDAPGDLSREHVLAEYVREGQRKFVLYADGHQETWRL